MTHDPRGVPTVIQDVHGGTTGKYPRHESTSSSSGHGYHNRNDAIITSRRRRRHPPKPNLNPQGRELPIHLDPRLPPPRLTHPQGPFFKTTSSTLREKLWKKLKSSSSSVSGLLPDHHPSPTDHVPPPTVVVEMPDSRARTPELQVATDFQGEMLSPPRTHHSNASPPMFKEFNPRRHQEELDLHDTDIGMRHKVPQNSEAPMRLFDPEIQNQGPSKRHIRKARRQNVAESVRSAMSATSGGARHAQVESERKTREDVVSTGGSDLPDIEFLTTEYGTLQLGNDDGFDGLEMRNMVDSSGTWFRPEENLGSTMGAASGDNSNMAMNAMLNQFDSLFSDSDPNPNTQTSALTDLDELSMEAALYNSPMRAATGWNNMNFGDYPLGFTGPRSNVEMYEEGSVLGSAGEDQEGQGRRVHEGDEQRSKRSRR